MGVPVESIIQEAIKYRDGKDVEIDLDRSINLLRSISSESDWASKELLIALTKRNKREDEREKFELSKLLSDKGDLNSTVRVAIYYRDGKGTEQDLEKSLEYFNRCKTSKWGMEELLKTYRTKVKASDEEKFELYQRLHDLGNRENDLHLAICYRDGKGIGKDTKMAFELIKDHNPSGAWERSEYAKIAISAGHPELVTIRDCNNLLPYLDKPEAKVNVELIDDLLKVVVDPLDYIDSKQKFKIKLYCNRVMVESKNLVGWKTDFRLKDKGLYYVEISVSYNNTEYHYRSLPVFYGSLDVNHSPVIDCNSSPDYYCYNYPYHDIIVFESEYELDLNYFENNGFTVVNHNFGPIWTYIVCNAKSLKDGFSEMYFSGEAIINGHFVYGSEDFVEDSLPDVAESIGNFTFVKIDDSNIVFGSDYFGMGKIFHYSGQSLNIYSNRYHLLLIAMGICNEEISLDEDQLASYFYLSSGMFSEQPTNNKMIVSGTSFLDNDCFIVINSEGASEKKTSLLDVISEEISDNDYPSFVEKAKIDLLDNLKIVLESKRFSKIKADITGGLDSRIILAALKSLSADKEIFVDTSGKNHSELDCASEVAERLGYNYSPAYVKYRRLSGGYGLPIEGSPNIDRYLDIISSFDMGTFDSSLMPLCKYGQEVLHLAGWCGEITTRSFVPKRTLRIAIYSDDSATDIIKRYIHELSSFAIAPYEYAGRFFEDNLLESLKKDFNLGIVNSIDNLYNDYRVRFHDDFSKDCSYGMPAWAPMMSKVCYYVHQNTSKKHNSFKFAFDLINSLNSDVSSIEYDSLQTNLERTVLLNGKLLEDEGRLLLSKDSSTKFEKLYSDADSYKSVINGIEIKTTLNGYELNTLIFKRSLMYLNELCSYGHLINLYPFIKDHVEYLANRKEWKSLIPFYKKLRTACSVIDISKKRNYSISKVYPLIYDDREEKNA